MTRRARQSLGENSGLTAPCGRGSLSAAHQIEPRPKDAVDARVFTQTCQQAVPKDGERGFALLLMFLLAAAVALMLYTADAASGV